MRSRELQSSALEIWPARLDLPCAKRDTKSNRLFHVTGQRLSAGRGG